MMRCLLVLFAALLVLPISAQAGGHEEPPRTHMVTAANPHATAAGLKILRAGGSAVDAAIAVQAVLGLVEPQSSGLAGGAFLMHYDAGVDELRAYDGRETAPAAIKETVFLGEDGTPNPKSEMIPGGKSVGVPGVLRMLEMAHEAHGKLAWAQLFEPAIQLAREGFEISPRLHFLIDRDKSLKLFEASRRYFYSEDGASKPVGTVLKNPAYADTLMQIAEKGADALYEGPIAEDIVSAVQTSEINPGALSLEDMKGYQPKVREPVCGPYRKWQICGMPPPSSGGVAVYQILKMLEGFNISAMSPGAALATNVLAEAARLAYADRAKYLADSDTVDVPVEGLIDAEYLANRRLLIEPGEVMERAPAGTPPGAESAWRQVEPMEVPATSHFSITDDAGNVVAMTTSVESAFGSRMMVRGMMLNNQLTDFSFSPEEDGRLVANRVAPNKRPLSSMSPTIVFDSEGRPVISVGSPGGPLIIMFVAKTLVGVLDWQTTIQQAIELPNFVYFGDTLYVERNTSLAQSEAALEEMGYKLQPASLASGLHGIIIHYDDKGRWLEGGADPRREGRIGAD